MSFLLGYIYLHNYKLTRTFSKLVMSTFSIVMRPSLAKLCKSFGCNQQNEKEKTTFRKREIAVREDDRQCREREHAKPNLMHRLAPIDMVSPTRIHRQQIR